MAFQIKWQVVIMPIPGPKSTTHCGLNLHLSRLSAKPQLQLVYRDRNMHKAISAQALAVASPHYVTCFVSRIVVLRLWVYKKPRKGPEHPIQRAIGHYLHTVFQIPWLLWPCGRSQLPGVGVSPLHPQPRGTCYWRGYVLRVFSMYLKGQGGLVGILVIL